MGGRGSRSTGSGGGYIDSVKETKIDTDGMREESLALVRQQRKTNDARAKRPIVISVYPGEKPQVTDGRHRIVVARELGDTTIEAEVLEYNRAGKVIRRTRKQVAL